VAKGGAGGGDPAGGGRGQDLSPSRLYLSSTGENLQKQGDRVQSQ
jgi:hypothetical protein